MKHWTAEAIIDFLHTHRDDLRQMGVEKIGLFGSYVRGEAHSQSDIDLLVQLTDKRFRTYAHLWNYLEEQLECKVDLLSEAELRDELRSYILPEVQYVEDL